MSLQNIEIELLRTLPALNLRPTLEAAQRAGQLLEAAREYIPHGQWTHFLARINLTQRTAHDYVTVFRHATNQRPAATLTIKQFLETIRRVKYLERTAERERVRAEVSALRGKQPDDIVLVNADARKYSWPQSIDAVVTDPPWADLSLYEWLATWAASHVAPGGPILIQCGTLHLPRIMSMMEKAGLIYCWTLSVVYSQSTQATPTGKFRGTWRPVLLYSVGRPVTPDESVSDVYTIGAGRKQHQGWEQPVEPFRFWLSKMVKPGCTVADPFTGSGTTAVVCRELALRFVGTEIDRANYRVARGRIRSALTPTES